MLLPAETCANFVKPDHGIITPVQCITGDIVAGERCILHCERGYRPTNRRAAICDPNQMWMPSGNLTCSPVSLLERHHTNLQQQFVGKPFIKCPPDAVMLLKGGQKLMLIKMERPKTNVDWWK